MKRPGGSAYLIVNFLMFQVGWWLCVMGGSIWALTSSIVITLIHRWLTHDFHTDLRLAALLLGMGIIHDNLLSLSGLLLFPSAVAPVWILCLWWLLGLTLRHSLAFIYYRPALAVFGGALGAMLAYGAGVTVSSAAWGISPWLALTVIGTLWAVVLPLHLALARRWRWLSCADSYG